ncbi:D-2-hydroxyacid dehydrogenase [Colwellia psychrerythraea]|uniref:Glycerate dehydrogenase n=1 Tax=Colwellia psychrerythraea TaxID=28229 RepID=A0A099KXV0_COLPS|nr:D-2-hydroxyacid dehydrogenase [Colwellia psychrerythraea]KGJ95441.1 Glycerate dehydrogenase [Colwellia psychrerythraea]
MNAVFLDKQTFSSTIDFTAIEQQVTQLVCYTNTSPTEVISRCHNADIIITNKVQLTAEMLSALPHVKLICISATGYNNVDIDAASHLNIAVTNVSGYAGLSVAQYVFAQLLEYYQQTSHHNSNTEQGLWSSNDTFCYHGNSISELAGKTLGIIGYGSLGKAVANIAQAFNMKVIISERHQASAIRPDRVSFEQVIKEADIISLHCPQTSDTQNLINESVLSCMKNTAVLVNTARGALIDEPALLTALKTKEIAYAILDVLTQEPPSADHILLHNQLSNLKVTAHIAWASQEAQQRLIALLSQNILAFAQGKRLNRLA